MAQSSRESTRRLFNGRARSRSHDCADALTKRGKSQVEKQEASAQEKAAATKAIADDAQRDLDEALPALDVAVACLKDLKKSDIDEVLRLRGDTTKRKMSLSLFTPQLGCCLQYPPSWRRCMLPPAAAGRRAGEYRKARPRKSSQRVPLCARDTVFPDALLCAFGREVPSRRRLPLGVITTHSQG